MKVIGWRAWVDTPTKVITIDSKTQSWSDIPYDGVICIMLYKDVEGHPPGKYREEMSGEDRYFMVPHWDGTIYGSSMETDEEIEARYPGAEIKRGKWVPINTFDKVYKEALAYVWA